MADAADVIGQGNGLLTAPLPNNLAAYNPQSNMLRGPVQGPVPNGLSPNGTPILPPGVAPDASAYMGSAQNRLITETGQAIAGAKEAKDYGITGAAGITAGANQVAQGQTAGIAADAATAALTQSNFNEIYGRWGTTPGKPSELIATLAASIQQEAMDVHNSRENINKKLSVNFLDDPVSWIINQVTVPFDLDELRSKRAGMEDDLEVLAKLRDATKEETVQAAATAYTLNSAKAAAMSEIALGTATQISGQAKAQLAGIVLNVSGAEGKFAETDFSAASTTYRDYLATDAGAISRALAGQSIDTTSYQKIINLQAAARNDEEGKLRIEILGLQDTDLNKKLAAQNALDARIDKLNAVVGTKFVNWQELAAMPDSSKKTTLLSLAADPNLQQGGALSLVGPAEAIQLANGLQLPLNGPGENLTRQKLTTMASDFERSQGQLWKSYTPDQRNILTDDYIVKQLQTQLHNIPAMGSVYSPPPMSTTLNLPGIAGTPLAIALTPLAKNGDGSDTNYPTEAKAVIAAAQQLISSGNATPEDMGAAVSQFYTSLAVRGDATSGYRKFTLASPTSTNTWNSSIPSESPSFISPYATHNLMNRAEMTNYFIRAAISARMLDVPPGVPQ